MTNVLLVTMLCSCNELAKVLILLAGVRMKTSLFMSIVISDLGVGRDEISMVKSFFAGIDIPVGMAKPILVLTELAVKGLASEPIFI